jgi:hypothetical protein
MGLVKICELFVGSLGYFSNSGQQINLCKVVWKHRIVSWRCMEIYNFLNQSRLCVGFWKNQRSLSIQARYLVSVVSECSSFCVKSWRCAFPPKNLGAVDGVNRGFFFARK